MTTRITTTIATICHILDRRAPSSGCGGWGGLTGDVAKLSSSGAASRACLLTVCAGSHRESATRIDDDSRVARRLHEQRGDDERNRRQQFDEDGQGGPRGILEWIAHGVADDRRLGRCASFAAEITGLNEFLGVVPGSAPGVQDERH